MNPSSVLVEAKSALLAYPEVYSGDSDMKLISRLSATCSPKQRKMIIAFIEMMLDHDEFE